MRVTLYVPGLLLPDALLRDCLFDLEAPSLSLLLARACRRELNSPWLPQFFGLASPLPVAALRQRAREGEWLCVDPVHLAVRREGVIVADPEQLNLDQAEAASLLAALQPLLAEYGQLHASAPGNWQLRLKRPVRLTLGELDAVVGQAPPADLPAGEDGRAWRGLLNEAQMLLHAHPVNQRRADLGSPTVNSLWLWGAGAAPSAHAAAPAPLRVFSDEAMLCGLAALAQAGCESPPPSPPPPPLQWSGLDWPSLLEGYKNGEILLQLPALRAAARRRDGQAWRTALLQLEKDWLAPALQALRSKHRWRLRLVGESLTAPSRSLLLEAGGGDLLRLWRRPQALTRLAAA